MDADQEYQSRFGWRGIEPSSDAVCPFCGEGDFDLIGLKLHLTNGHCEPFNDTPSSDT